MKKKVVLLMIAAMLTGVLAGCGNNGNTENEVEENVEAEDTVEDSEEEEASNMQPARDYDTSEYVTLGDYKGLEISIVPLEEITDEVVEEYIASVMSNYSNLEEITDRPAQTGDVVMVKSVGATLDGEVFDESGEEGYEVEIGGSGYIEGYAESLEGREVGETFDVTLTFPENYNEELAGKDAVFTMTVLSINKKTPAEFTDEFLVQQGSPYTTVEEYRTELKKGLESQAQSNYDADKEDLTLTQVIENAEFKDLPDELVQYYSNNIKDNIAYYATNYGYDYDTYIQGAYQMTAEDFEATTLVEWGIEAAQKELAVIAIALAEGISVSDDELTAEIAEQMELYGLTTEEEFLAGSEREDYRDYVLKGKVVDFIMENGNVTFTE